MELEDLKGAWAHYDQKLSENLKFNEKLLQKMNLNHSKREMQKPFIYECIGIAILFILLAYISAFLIRYIHEPKYAIPGFISAVVTFVCLIFGLYRANRFLNIEYYGSSVLTLQKDIARLKKLVLSLRKYEMALYPILVITVLPLLFKTIHNYDIYQNIKLLSIEIALVIGISLPLTLWINKHLYDKKFKNTESLLAELEKFEKEG